MDRIPLKFVINLAKRPDRLREAHAEFSRVQLAGVQRFDAVEHARGGIGCGKSHAAVLRAAAEAGAAAVLVMEDDVAFRASRAELDAYVAAFLACDAAEALCLAFSAYAPPTPQPGAGAGLRRCTNTQTASCYVLKASILRDVLAAFEAGVAGLEAGGEYHAFAIDQVWKRLQGDRVWLVPPQHAAVQRPSFSDIEQRHVAYGV